MTNRYKVIRERALVELRRRIDNVNREGIDEAKERLKIIKFFNRYGAKATKEAFGVCRTTVYNWKRLLRENGGNIRALISLSRRPIRRRVRKIHPAIIEFIRDYRNKHRRCCQKVIKPVLDRFCNEKGLKCISESTIARVIKDLKERGEIDNELRMSFNARTGKIKVLKREKVRKERRKDYKPFRAGDLVQIDSITLFKEGIRRYIITAVDLQSRFGFAYAYERLNSRNAKDFMSKLEYVAPFKIRHVQTDNGGEFGKYFERYITAKEIKHFWNYPKRPQSNGHVERFNRTVKESFIDGTDIEIFDDIEEYNRRLMEWLIWYNGERYHRSIDMTPIDYIVKEKIENKELNPILSKMYRDHTVSVLDKNIMSS